ncbi:MAG: nitroreductase family protein [Nanoarchaeota archaeon]|nr:nitroreductase family protein [Nanoarchaeota archaeon]
MNSTIDTIKNRRSIRKYENKKISKELINEIIDAGIYAPSSHNSQPWNFTIITHKKVIDELSDEIKAWYASLVKIGVPLSFIKKVREAVEGMRRMVNSEKDLFFYNAPVVMIIHAKSHEFYQKDCACCAQNMMLAARSLGIGSCWIGFADIVLNKSRKMRKKLGIPVSHRIMATLVFGYAVKFPSKALPRNRFKKDFI